MPTITLEDTTSDGVNPVFKGTYPTDYATVEVTVDNSGQSLPDTVVTGKSLGGEYFIPADDTIEAVTEYSVKAADTGSVVTGNKYNMGPKIVRANNGDYFIFYTSGTSHISDDDVVVYKKLAKGADPASGWGSETLIKEDLTYSVGARITAAGVDRKTGRIMLFIAIRDDSVGDFATFESLYMYSDDNCATWTEIDYYPTMQTVGTGSYGSIYPSASPNSDPDAVAFGIIFRTSVGLMVPFYASAKTLVVVFSYDDGDSWDFSNPIEVADLDGLGLPYNEPNVVMCDPDTLVILCRDQNDPGDYTWSKSTDGGLTWTAFATPSSAYTGTMPLSPSPMTGWCVGERVYGAFTLRENYGKHVYTCISKTEFLADPSDLWQTSATIRVEEDISPASRPSIDAGYHFMETIPGHEYTVYDVHYNPGTNSGEVDVKLRTVPIV